MTPSTFSILGYEASTVLLDNAILMLWTFAAAAIGYGIGRIHERFRAEQPQ